MSRSATGHARRFLLAVLVASAASLASAATFTVSNVSSSGSGSLAQAILDANGNAGADTIAFDIVGGCATPCVIALGSPLPDITDVVTIDGYTQAGSGANTLPNGNDAVIKIELDATVAGEVALVLAGGGATIRGLAIGHFLSGIVVQSDANTVEGCYIGTDASGTASQQNLTGIDVQSGAGNHIGGTASGQRNLISGNTNGIQVSGGSDTSIIGNWIGLDASGSTALQNLTGIFCGASAAPQAVGSIAIGGAAPGEGNRISGNYNQQIFIDGSPGAIGPVSVQGNAIGSTIDGGSPGAQGGAVVLNDINTPDANNVLIGGNGPGAGNEIAFGGDPVVFVFGSHGIAVEGNSIRSSGQGILLFREGAGSVLPNDPCDVDEGANHLQNYPEVTAASIDSGMLTISGTLDSVASTTYRVEIFLMSACELPDESAGETFVAAVDVTTDAACAGSFGPLSFPVLTGQAQITLTATDPDGNTSQFSNCFQAGGDVPDVTGASPSSGPSDADVAITIAGARFVAPVTAAVGGVPANAVVYNGPTSVSAVVPANTLPPGGLYTVAVTNPTPETGRLLHAFFSDFLDVPQDDIFHDYVETLIRSGVTVGVGGGNYGRDLPTARRQMAVFLLKASQPPGYFPPPCTGTVFTDVSCLGDPFDPWIEDLAARGITGGCGGGNFCPLDTVTRAQMAPFLLKTKLGSSYIPPACTGSVFTDVPCQGGIFDPWIEDLAGRGITGGCGGGNYCPSNPNTRGQMAVFLVKTFNLQ